MPISCHMAKQKVKRDLPYGSGLARSLRHICRMAHAPLPNLKRLRGAMTLEQLSEKSGVSVSQLSRYERGGADGRDPKLGELQLFAKLFGTTISELVGETPSAAAVDPILLYKGQLKDTDCIQVEVGVLRALISEALADEGLVEAEALAYADGVLGSLLERRAETVVVRLTARVRSAPASRGPALGDPT